MKKDHVLWVMLYSAAAFEDCEEFLNILSLVDCDTYKRLKTLNEYWDLNELNTMALRVLALTRMPEEVSNVIYQISNELY